MIQLHTLGRSKEKQDKRGGRRSWEREWSGQVHPLGLESGGLVYSWEEWRGEINLGTRWHKQPIPPKGSGHRMKETASQGPGRAHCWTAGPTCPLSAPWAGGIPGESRGPSCQTQSNLSAHLEVQLLGRGSCRVPGSGGGKWGAPDSSPRCSLAGVCKYDFVEACAAACPPGCQAARQVLRL